MGAYIASQSASVIDRILTAVLETVLSLTEAVMFSRACPKSFCSSPEGHVRREDVCALFNNSQRLECVLDDGETVEDHNIVRGCAAIVRLIVGRWNEQHAHSKVENRSVQRTRRLEASSKMLRDVPGLMSDIQSQGLQSTPCSNKHTHTLPGFISSVAFTPHAGWHSTVLAFTPHAGWHSTVLN